MSEPDLHELRAAIEAVDLRILAALRERMTLVEDVARAKLAQAVPIRDPLREDEVLRRVRASAVEAGLDPHELERIYRLVMAMSVQVQQAHLQSLPDAPLRVSYQGVEGSYSHLTAQRRWAGRPGGVLLVGCETFREAMEALREGEVDLALLPIENTTAGSINATYDLLAAGGVTIVGEAVSVIDHCLMALPGVTIDELKVCLSHPQALAQCEDFFRSHEHLEAREAFDTAGAARRVREAGDRAVGAIASESAAHRYGLEILRRGIQSITGNYTRFVEVAREAIPCADVPCRTSLLLSLLHRPGALGEILQELSRRNVSLTKLESRPTPGRPWQYRFFIDIEGHAAAEDVAGALDAISSLTAEMRILGSYPRVKRPGEVEERSGSVPG